MTGIQKNKIGYLAPEGTFYECEYYGHLDLACKLCKELYNKEFYYGVDAEEYLYSVGFVVFYSRSVGFRKFGGDKLKVLTPEQKYFLMDEVIECDLNEKVDSIKEILSFNEQVNKWGARREDENVH